MKVINQLVLGTIIILGLTSTAIGVPLSPTIASCLPTGPIKSLALRSSSFNGSVFGFDEAPLGNVIRSASQLVSFSTIIKIEVGASTSSYPTSLPWTGCSSYLDLPTGRLTSAYDATLACTGLAALGWSNNQISAVFMVNYQDCQ